MAKFKMKPNAQGFYTDEAPDGSVVVTYLIKGVVTPFVPARISGALEDSEPEQCPEVEDFEVEVSSVEYWAEMAEAWREDKDLTDEYKTELATNFEARVHKEPSLMTKIEEMLYEEVEPDERPE